MSLKNIYMRIIWLALFLVFLSSCSKLKRIGVNDAETVLKNELRIKYYSKSKPQFILIENANIKIEGKETNRAKINFYLEKDQQFFVSIKLLGFETMRLQLSKDSVKYINRLNREYYFENIENVQKELGELPNFTDLENLVTTGFISSGSINFDNFFINSRISGDSLRFSNTLGPGKNVLCTYSLEGLQLFNLAYLDYVKQMEAQVFIQRNEFGLNSIQGIFVNKGWPTKFSVDIGEIKNEKFSKTDFRIGRNYNEIKTLL